MRAFAGFECGAIAWLGECLRVFGNVGVWVCDGSVRGRGNLQLLFSDVPRVGFVSHVVTVCGRSVNLSRPSPSAGFLPPQSVWGNVAPTWLDNYYRNAQLQVLACPFLSLAPRGLPCVHDVPDVHTVHAVIHCA